jgi:tetratricopeptide (TPR) repeat protein
VGKDLARAERCFRYYLTRDPEGNAPSHAQAHWRLGLVLEEQGRGKEAIAALETALRLRPDLEDAKKDLARLRSTLPRS